MLPPLQEPNGESQMPLISNGNVDVVEDVNSGRDSRGSQRDKKKDKKDKKDKKNKKGSRDGNGDDEGVEMQDLWALMLQRNGRLKPKKTWYFTRQLQVDRRLFLRRFILKFKFKFC